jgi:hypothetical protein
MQLESLQGVRSFEFCLRLLDQPNCVQNLDMSIKYPDDCNNGRYTEQDPDIATWMCLYGNDSIKLNYESEKTHSSCDNGEGQHWVVP